MVHFYKAFTASVIHQLHFASTTLGGKNILCILVQLMFVTVLTLFKNVCLSLF